MVFTGTMGKWFSKTELKESIMLPDKDKMKKAECPKIKKNVVDAQNSDGWLVQEGSIFLAAHEWKCLFPFTTKSHQCPLERQVISTI